MTRKLLPYEHDLIATLGVTEEEYLDFLSIQETYVDPKEGTIADIRNMPFLAPVGAAFAAVAAGTAVAAQIAIVATTISLALTVVGIVFQVASVLLADKPSAPKAARAQRDKRFSPRFGFNSSQELAQYGDPVNLVYCNTSHNDRGAVRVAAALVWSAVEGSGSSQFMQLLMVLGAANIKRLDYDRIAFGQLPLGQFSGSNVWLYYNQNGRVKYNDKILGDGKDPTREGAPGSEDVCRIGDRKDGFSQAFSPTSLTSIGVYDPIPVNVKIQERRSSGRPQWRTNGVTIAGGNWPTGQNNRFNKGESFTLVFAQARPKQDKVAQEAAKDLRYQFVESLDRAATYMLGTAMFRLVSVEPDNANLDRNDVRAKFECIEAGSRPTTNYGEERSKNWNDDDLDNIEEAFEQLKDDASDATITGPEFIKTGKPNLYSLVDNTTDETDYTYTIAYGRTVSRNITNNFEGIIDNISGGDISVDLRAFGGKNYKFTGTEEIKWTSELDQRKTVTFPRGGSIAVTRAILESFLGNKPKLDVKALRDEIEDDLEKLRQTIDDLNSGDLDGEFRKAAKQAASNLARQINNLQEEKQKLIRNIDLDKKDVRVQKTGGGNVDVLNTNTGLKGKPDKLDKLDKEIDNLQDDRKDLISDNTARSKKALIVFYRNTNSPFTAFGNRYGSGGIKAMKRRLAGLKGQTVTDQVGVKAVRDALKSLIEDKENAKNLAKYVSKRWEELIATTDNNFYTKCLVKAEYAAYQTVTACNFVKFSISAKVFRRISGRAKNYGEMDAPDSFKLSDNGLTGRIAYFIMRYRKTGTTNYTTAPIVFAFRRASDQDNFVALNFKASELAKWEFEFYPIGDITATLDREGINKFAFIANSGRGERLDLPGGANIRWTGNTVLRADAFKERGPSLTNEWDLFSNRSDTQTAFSFDNGPEFRITAVTEQQVGSIEGKYDQMSMLALGVYSGKGVQDLRSITAYVEEGKSSYVVNNDGTYSLSNGSTSFAPDIFADTVLDNLNGIGKYAKPDGIDWNGLALAKRFCKSNGLGTQLFMDGVIADITSWRQFWVENAPFSLLEFARVGGRETLIPAVPTNNAGVANREVNISALFTTGNILEGSYKEEFIDYGDSTQDIIATVIYRETEAQDVFPRNASVQVKLKDATEASAIRQTFDASQFVTRREQAILFGKLVCNQRRHIRRGIEFKTFPTDSPISPAAYIYVDIGLQTWDGITSGVIMEGGELNAPLTDGIANGSYSVLTYKNDQPAESFTSVTVTNGVAASLASKAGSMFVLGAQSNRKRVFRVTEVQMDEEGEVTVKAMEYPCVESGGKLLSRVANFSDSLFEVR
jgi:hypothetical protein